MIKVGILGGSGYMGGEVARILIDHPEAKIEWITSRRDKPIEYFHRNLMGKKHSSSLTGQRLVMSYLRRCPRARS